MHYIRQKSQKLIPAGAGIIYQPIKGNQFTVHALDVEHIEVDADASGAMVGFNVHFHSLGSASLTVLYR
ncbi:hypothetical protein GGER_13760 [Serratia rubidaea]